MPEILKEIVSASLYKEEQAKLRNTIANSLMGLNIDVNPNVMTYARIKEILNAGKGTNYFEVGDQIVVEKETYISVTPSNEGLTVAFDEDTFLDKEHEAGNKDYIFSYTELGWTDNRNVVVDLAEYGITLTGTPTVGDTITVHETASELVFDIANVTDAKITLVAHESVAKKNLYPAQAKWAASDGSQLPAGKYKISSTLSFTATQPFYCAKPSNTTLSTSVTVTTYGANRASVESGLAVAADVANVDGDLTASGCVNSDDRVNYGSNNYLNSAVRQYLNGTGIGGWWSPRTIWDIRPGFHGEAGFMHGIDPAFLDVLDEGDKIWKDNNDMTYGGTGTHTFTDKFYLLCAKDVNFYSSSDESDAALDLFKGGLSASDNATAQNALRKKIVGSGYNYWWTRTAKRDNTNGIALVATDGALYYGNASGATGVVPACAISADSE